MVGKHKDQLKYKKKCYKSMSNTKIIIEAIRVCLDSEMALVKWPKHGTTSKSICVVCLGQLYISHEKETYYIYEMCFFSVHISRIVDLYRFLIQEGIKRNELAHFESSYDIFFTLN